VHSTLSDGSASPIEIASCVREVGLDFVVLADHDTCRACGTKLDGVYDGIVLIAGTEITPPRSPHCLVWGVDLPGDFRPRRAEEYVPQISARGGTCFACHPNGRRVWRFSTRSKKWRKLLIPGLRGMEIWSFVHDWLRELRPWQVGKFIRAVTSPARDLPGPERHLLKKWDKIGKKRRFVGVCALDAHGRRLPLTERQFLPYYHLIRALVLHVIVFDEKILTVRSLQRAIEEGRCFMANDWLADSTGFDFLLSGEEGEETAMGGEVPFRPGRRLQIRVPARAETVLMRDGEAVFRGEQRKMEFEVRAPGVYRVEVVRDGKPWIFSNPIYIRS